MPPAKLSIEIPEGPEFELTIRRGPGLARCPGIIETTGHEVFPDREPPSSIPGAPGAPALRLLPAPEPADELTHVVPRLREVG